MIYHFILNPKSGRSRKNKNIESYIKKACRKREINYHIYYTTCPGDATEYVKSMVRISQEHQRFICLGGDGTLNEIVNSAPCNPSVDFGVIPSGSGNDFIRNFTNTGKFQSIYAQLDGATMPFDLIKCNDFYCVNMINIGFDCSVVKEADHIKKRKLIPPGLSYILGVFVVLCKKFGTKMSHIAEDGTVYEEEYTLTTIANGRYCGGGFMSNPIAELNDELFDVCAIKKVTRATFLSLLSCYKKGKHLHKKRAGKYIRYSQEKQFKIEFDSPVPICVDGEIKGAKSVELSAIKNGFNFVVPKGCELRRPKHK